MPAESEPQPYGRQPGPAFRWRDRFRAAGDWPRLRSSAHPKDAQASQNGREVRRRKRRIFSDCVPSAPLSRSGKPTTISPTSYLSGPHQEPPSPALVLALDGFQSLGGDAQRVGNGNADTPRTHIKGQDAAMQSWHGTMMGGRAGMQVKNPVEGQMSAECKSFWPSTARASLDSGCSCNFRIASGKLWKFVAGRQNDGSG